MRERERTPREKFWESRRGEERKLKFERATRLGEQSRKREIYLSKKGNRLQKRTEKQRD